MGSSLAIAWGAAKSNPHQVFVAIDGDQNAVMNEMEKVLPSDYPANLDWYSRRSLTRTLRVESLELSVQSSGVPPVGTGLCPTDVERSEFRVERSMFSVREFFPVSRRSPSWIPLPPPNQMSAAADPPGS